MFVVHGLVFASWTAHIPHVKAALGLSDGGLGLALLGAPVGSVIATLLCGRLLARWGSPRVVLGALAGYSTLGIAVGQAGSPGALFGALMIWGVFQGTLDVAMNTQGITVERAMTRPIMSGLHAWWSVGAFAGAGLGALGVAVGLSLTAQMLVLGPVAGGVAAIGMAGGLVTGAPVVALTGLATLGLGLGLIVPAAYSAAGRLTAIATGQAIAVVSAIGWIGFVGGPPVIGRLAQLTSLPVALALLPALTLAMAAAVAATDVFRAQPLRDS